jgi:hypothetical protein
MARLIVEARTSEVGTLGYDVVYVLRLAVSVSRADDGQPVTGLKPENFRVANFYDKFQIVAAYELEWGPAGTEPSGCYVLDVMSAPGGRAFVQGGRYVLGLEARTFGSESPLNVVDQGQTILDLISEGQ